MIIYSIQIILVEFFRQMSMLKAERKEIIAKLKKQLDQANIDSLRKQIHSL